MSLLSNTAAQWALPYLKCIDSADPMFTRDGVFKTKFLKMFGHPDRRKEAERKLNELKQGNGTACNYYANFRYYSTRLGWNDEALISLFRLGLRENVKDELARNVEPPTLTNMALKAITIDNRLAEQAHKHCATGQPPTNAPYHPYFQNHTPTTGTTTTTLNTAKKDPNTMEVDTSKMSKEQLQKEGRCFRCHKKGHLSCNCTKKQVAAASEGDDSDSASGAPPPSSFPKD
jgi:hypothetical protein